MPSEQLDASIPLFSYGTLQQDNVQIATFGRLLDGRPDTMTGFRLEPLEITDAAVIAASGKAVHTIAVASGDPGDRIDGTLFWITPAELDQADRYEVDPVRIKTVLESGQQTFVYVSPKSSAKA